MPIDVFSQCQPILGALNKTLIGKPDSVKMAMITLLSGGHLLIEDMPGVGKTTLAKALAKVFGGEFRRIQFTPDLLPSDVTGTSIFQQSRGEFEFQPGPIFANFVLADEINRATPKAQSALLEAMEEKQVSADGVQRPLPVPHFVLATQNNIEMMGTFPLPEAQLDRFFARVSIGYPDREAEILMLQSHQQMESSQGIEQVSDLQTLSAMQQTVRELHVEDRVREYAVDVVRATRSHAQATLGASPRATLHLIRAAQAHAALANRSFVVPDDIKAIASNVLSHRLIVRGGSASDGRGNDVVEGILERVPAPVPVR